MIVVLMGKMGCNKYGVVKKLLRKHKSLEYVPAYSTRQGIEGVFRRVENGSVEDIRTSSNPSRILTFSGVTIRDRLYSYYYNLDEFKEGKNYIVLGTPFSFGMLRDLVGKVHDVIGCCIEDDYIRLRRVTNREMVGDEDYIDLCKRFISNEGYYTKETLSLYNIDIVRVEDIHKMLNKWNI